MRKDINEILETFEKEMDNSSITVADTVEIIKKEGYGLDAVSPILHLMEKYPQYDWGNPGHFAHFMETFSDKGYEEKLIESVRRKPITNTLFLVYRCGNGAQTEEEGNIYLSLLKEVLERTDIDEVTRETAEQFIEWLEE